MTTNGRAYSIIVTELAIRIEAVTAAQTTAARQAWHDFGLGRHSAKRNSGDCLAYGLATVTGESLLFKGHDFSQTDIEPALKA